MFKIFKLSVIYLITVLSLSTQAENRIEIFFGSNNLSFDRHSNDFIGSNEAAGLKSKNIGGYLARDLDENTAISILGKYDEYNTDSIISLPEDDSPKDSITLEATLMRNIFQNSLGGATVFLGDIETEQNGENVNKRIQGYNLSFVNEIRKLTYMLTMGKQTSGSVEAQDTVRNAKYSGVVLNYDFNNNIDLGFKLSEFVGNEYDEKTIKSEQTSRVSSIFADYNLSNAIIRAGYKLYDNEREDVEGRNIGEIEDANGEAFFFSLSLPFGQTSSKKERILITEKPDIVEFSAIMGSIGD